MCAFYPDILEPAILIWFYAYKRRSQAITASPEGCYTVINQPRRKQMENVVAAFKWEKEIWLQAILILVLSLHVINIYYTYTVTDAARFLGYKETLQSLPFQAQGGALGETKSGEAWRAIGAFLSEKEGRHPQQTEQPGLGQVVPETCHGCVQSHCWERGAGFIQRTSLFHLLGFLLFVFCQDMYAEWYSSVTHLPDLPKYDVNGKVRHCYSLWCSQPLGVHSEE